MTEHYYEWDNDKEDSATVVYNLMLLLMKLKVGYTHVSFRQNHVADTILVVQYKNHHQAPQSF